MFLIISWMVTGAVFGSIGVAQVASALSDGPRPDPNLDAIFLSLFLTTLVGAVGGGILASMARRKFADNKRSINSLCCPFSLPLLWWAMPRSASGQGGIEPPGAAIAKQPE